MQEQKHNFAHQPLDMSELPLTLHGEECLIIDDRGQQSPSQQVEERLVQLLRRKSFAVSLATGRSVCRDRSQFHGPN